MLLRGNLLLLMLMLAGFRFIILSTAYIIPTYLQAVQNFRELQVGQVLLWIALPQLVIALPLAALLRRIDGRLFLTAGTLLIGIACVMAAQLTSAWATQDFLPSQILQAVGQSFALTALVMLIVRSIVPAEALTIGCLLQISRLFGGEIGTAFMQTLVRVREQLHSNLIGLHVTEGAGMTADRLSGYIGTARAPMSRTRRKPPHRRRGCFPTRSRCKPTCWPMPTAFRPRHSARSSACFWWRRCGADRHRPSERCGA